MVAVNTWVSLWCHRRHQTMSKDQRVRTKVSQNVNSPPLFWSTSVNLSLRIQINPLSFLRFVHTKACWSPPGVLQYVPCLLNGLSGRGCQTCWEPGLKSHVRVARQAYRVGMVQWLVWGQPDTFADLLVTPPAAGHRTLLPQLSVKLLQELILTVLLKSGWCGMCGSRPTLLRQQGQLGAIPATYTHC